MNPLATNRSFFNSAKRLHFHITFWVVFSLGTVLQLRLFGHSWYSAFIVKGIFLPFQLIAAYVLIFIFIDKMLFKQRYLLFIGGSILFTFLFSVLTRIIFDTWIWATLQDDFNRISWWEMIADMEGIITFYMRLVFLFPFILICFEIAFRQKENNKIVSGLELEKAKMELDFLKTQTHPHFILSTLRNLEQMTYEQDDRAPAVVEKLADTLEFILYDGPKNLVPLKKELEIITELLDLLRLKYEGKIEINSEISIKNDGLLIPPLIVFSFIENNFRNIDGLSVPFESCDIYITQKDDKIIMQLTNHPAGNSQTIGYPEKDMKKQLSLTYTDNYRMDQNIDNDRQVITLTLSI